MRKAGALIKVMTVLIFAALLGGCSQMESGDSGRSGGSGEKRAASQEIYRYEPR
ncbi:MAG: hypothetical protein UIL73_05895 [Anaerovoracaceae bacterium]|nr:hypothetical protein [Anaerovoracaceae bacterium]